MVRFLPLAALILVVSACSGGGDEAETSGAPSASAASSTAASDAPTAEYRALSKAEAKAALLKLSDMPTGFSEDPEPESGSDPRFGSGDDACKQFVAAAYGDDDVDVHASALYLEGELGPYVKSSVAVRTLTDSKKRMDEFIESLQGCKKFVDGSDGTTTKVSLVSFPRLGDQSVAIRLGFESADFSGSSTVVSVRLGPNTITVGDAGVTGGLETATLEKLVRKAVAKASSDAKV